MPPRTPHLCWLTGLAPLLLIVSFLAGCGEQGKPAGRDGATGTASPTIVSLSPALTQMLIDMGKGDQLIGVSNDDRAAELGLPACGTYNRPDIERLLALSPGLVITQPVGDATPAKLRQLDARGVFSVVDIPHAMSVADVSRSLEQLGQGIGDPEAAAAADGRMQRQLAALADAVKGLPRPRVLLLLDPSVLGVIGPGTTHDELLHIAGGINAAASFQTPYLQLSRAQLVTQAKPDIILLIQPNGPPLDHSGDPRLRGLTDLPMPDGNAQQIHLISHPQGLLPSTTVAEIARDIARAIHPESHEAIGLAYDQAAAGQTLPSEATP